MNKMYQIKPTELSHLYIEKQFSLQEIADFYGCGRELEG